VVLNIREIEGQLEDSLGLLELAEADDDQETVAAVDTDLAKLNQRVEELEFRRMFSGEMDPANAYLDIQAGSGGTEAQDWANMLLRMYLRWGERRGFKTEMIELSEGEVAGIKSATVRFEGEYAFGWLRTETGRPPAGAQVAVRFREPAPHLLRGGLRLPGDRRFHRDRDQPRRPAVDTYRASGAGGQHVNRTESAIRITHMPSGIVVACQSDRSQHKNRDTAMKQLKAKLYEMEIQKRNVEKQAQEDAKSDIGWGSQIRSYVLDQSRIKDLRTGVEVGNTQAVLDGDLDQFIEASLKSGL
jgi:peptide chain release factor 2